MTNALRQIEKGFSLLIIAAAVAQAQDTGHRAPGTRHQAPGHNKVTAVTSDHSAYCHHHHHQMKANLTGCPCERVELHRHIASCRPCQPDYLSTHYLFILIYILLLCCCCCCKCREAHTFVWHERHLCHFSGTTSCRFHKWTQPAHTYIYSPFAPPPLEALLHTINIACKLCCALWVSQPKTGRWPNG